MRLFGVKADVKAVNPEPAAFTSKPKPMRERMPVVTAGLDQLREVFGTDGINAAIKAGMHGEPGRFWANENGIELGTKGDL